MKSTTLEAWQVYAQRCKRLDAEAEKAMKPFWKTLAWWQIAAIALIELGSLALMNRLMHLL